MSDNRLDLSRPELRSVAERYFPPVALIVRGKEPTEELEDALHEDGWKVKVCHGPEEIRCPMAEGRPCSLRESADAAIVVVSDDWDDREPLMDRLHCAGDRTCRTVLAIENSDDAPRRLHHITLQGARPVAAIVAEADEIAGRSTEG